MNTSFPIASDNELLKAGIAEQYAEYETDEAMTWCGGCGNYAIATALKSALAIKGIKRDEVFFCYDVGCSGNASDKIEGCTIHGLHGRVLPLAAGAKIANKDLLVIAEAGDGATFSEGVGHLVHAVRNDYPIVFLHHDNQNYGLTTGQASSLSPKGCKRNSAPNGVVQDDLNPLQMVLGMRPSFVAQTISADVHHMTEIFIKAMDHPGFSFINILQCCPTYNRDTSNEWYLENAYDVNTKKYDETNLLVAQELVHTAVKIPLGIIYHNPEKENFVSAMGIDRNLSATVKAGNVGKFVKDL